LGRGCKLAAGATLFRVNDNPFTYGLGSDGGHSATLVDVIAAFLSLAIAVGGSMFWVRWRERQRRPKA
jgi:hypothetical protein